MCDGGVLLERIEKDGYSEKVVVRIVRSILRFISQCHARGFIYRDVKVRNTFLFLPSLIETSIMLTPFPSLFQPDNFLFQSRDPDSPLKATDFGLSIRHWPEV